MKRFLCVALALPLCAGSRVTVQQLAEMLDSARCGHTADAGVAADIGRLQLEERLSGASLSLLERGAGAKTIEALGLIADESAFLDPTGDAIAPGPVPRAAEQRAMVEQAEKYVLQYIKVLPNLVCTQITRRFDDAPLPDNPHQRGDLHLRDITAGELTVRDGTESFRIHSLTTVARGGMLPRQNERTKLLTSGEFGSILAGLFIAPTTKFAWLRWEMLDGRRVAVFGYSVPEPDSRFTVFWAGDRGRWPERHLELHRRAGYRGEVSIDPVSGAITRLTQQAVDLPRDFPIQRDDTAVEYGSVDLGGEACLCPRRSVTIIDELQRSGPHAHYLNRVEFTDYHRFKAESKIVADTQ